MRATYYPIFPLLWIVIWLTQVILNFDYYMTTKSGRTYLFFIVLMIAAGALIFIYLALLAYAPKLMYKVMPNKRCPNCYARVKKNTGFCIKCGAVLDVKGLQNLCKCAICGTSIDDPDRDFCPKCGSVLRK